MHPGPIDTEMLKVRTAEQNRQRLQLVPMKRMSQTWDEPTFLVKGANITPDLTTGIGTWSAEELKRSLIDGVRPDHPPFGGVPLAPQMPFPFYKILTPSDLDAVVPHVRSVRPVQNEVQPPVYKAPMHVKPIPGA